MKEIKENCTFDDFLKLDIRCGTVVEARVNEKARKPAYILTVDFGKEAGLRKSSAQITEVYKVEELIGKQILGVLNFPVKLIAGFRSEFLILGLYTDDGVVLITPDRKTENGAVLG